MSDPDRASAVFSLDLSDDVVQMRDWLHEFAASVRSREKTALARSGSLIVPSTGQVTQE